MTEIYTKAELLKLERKYSCCKRVILVLILISLFLCIALCVFTRTVNSTQHLLATVSVSVISGWIVIFLLNIVLLPMLHEISHRRGIMKEQKTIEDAIIVSAGERIHIPGSIDIVTIQANVGSETKTYRILARFAADIPVSGSKIRISSMRGYVTWLEVTI